MFAPPVAAASSDIHPPCPSVVEQPSEIALVSESTLSQLGFPNEFPYEFDSLTFSSSPGDSTETEDETSDDEDDFFAGLTRRLALSTQRLPSPPSYVTDNDKASEVKQPESTLSRLGSLITSGNKSPNGPFSQVPSPPESPCRQEDSLKVISAAAGEVAKIRMAKPTSRRTNPNPPTNSFIPSPQYAAFCGYYNYYNWPWQPQPALIASPYPVISVYSAPTAVKQPSPGTGVFLPRKYSNPSDSRKKAGSGCVKLPTKVVGQPQQSKTETFSGRCQSSSQARLSTTGRNTLDHGTDNLNIPNLDSQTQFPNLQ